MDDKKKDRCSHTGCSCIVGSEYCSPHCETLKTDAELDCECGHPQCNGKID